MKNFAFIALNLCLFACDSKQEAVREPTQVVTAPSLTSEQRELREFDDRILWALDSAYALKQNPAMLVKLDSIVCFSDGELAEGVGVVASHMYEADKASFFRSVRAHN